MNTHSTSINLKELSVLTGFSVSTVSKALNGKLDVSTKTKRLIMDVAEEHNYVPNSLGVRLRNKKSYTVAIIVPQINIKVYSNLLFYFHQIADCRGYRIIVFQSFKSELKETECLHSLCDGSIDGAIVFSNVINNFYTRNYKIPILTIEIREALIQENLSKYCFQKFEKLIGKGA